MKNKSLFQFSLSALFTMVLAACGSNGGNNDVPTTTATPTITPTPVVETNTTATTPAPEQKTEKPVENVDAQKLDVQPAESAFVGYKHVSKNASRFLINTDTDGSQGNYADVPVGMNLRNLSPVMDTLVVAEPTMPDENGKMKVGYLEDLDFRSGDNTPTRQALGTYAFMQIANGGTAPVRQNGGNVRELLSGVITAPIDKTDTHTYTGRYSAYTSQNLSVTKTIVPQDGNLTYPDFVRHMEAATTELSNAQSAYVSAMDTAMTYSDGYIDNSGSWVQTNQRTNAINSATGAWERARTAYLEATLELKHKCSADIGNRACSQRLAVNYTETSTDRNDGKYYTVHVADSNVSRDGKTRINDETNNEEKSEFRSWSHMARSNNNTKSDRKAVDENLPENQYYAYIYQANRTNYTDETMPQGLVAIPVYEGTGTARRLTGFKYANTTTDYTNSALRDETQSARTPTQEAENLTRKSRTDMNENSERAESHLTKGALNKRNGTEAHKDKNIAEVYGYRTFARINDGYQIGRPVNDSELPNLPLENKQLKKVQYGRVTSALSGHSSFDDFREGLKLDPTGKLETYVVSYGVFGQDGTEDHYFYRGIDSITPEQLKDLSAKTAGVLKYWGHAVSYGLDDKWDGNPESNVAPTAIGNTTVGRFVSGNHAHAVVDLKSGDVHGSIYNSWYNQDVADEARRAGNTDPKAGLYAVDLVKFNGRLATNGNISGTSVYQKDGSTGLFGANLYGSDASEIGGIVASDDKNKNKKWGAVFGGVRVGGGEIQNATNRGGL